MTKNAWEFKLSSRKPYFEVFTTAATGRWETQSGISPNEWHHLVVTYDNSSNSNVPVFYVDGVAVTTVVTGTPTGTQNSDSGSNLEIGGIFSGFSGGFDGVIDDVRIYNRILTADEIADLYTGTTGSVAGICGTGGVRDADGNTYGIVQIGTQCWLDRNMNVGTRVNAATTQTNNGTIERWCYDDTLSNCTDNHPRRPDGGLYQWDEAMQYSTTEGAQGICPSGWHIPTHDEFTTLERAVCTSNTCNTAFPYDAMTFGFRGTTEGTRLKANGSSLWEGNLAGYRFDGSFSDRATNATFWTSSEIGGSAWHRTFFLSSGYVYRDTADKSGGVSVRCLKN